MQVTGMEEHSHGYAALDQSQSNQKESLKPHQTNIKALETDTQTKTSMCKCFHIEGYKPRKVKDKVFPF